jgi:hypothetical protein
MARLRRLLSYAVCVAIATPPLAYGQASAPSGSAPKQAPATVGVTLSAKQRDDYARLMITWPSGVQGEARATIGGGLALIRLSRPLDIDPSVFARNAPAFVGGAALSADKRTIRLGLIQNVRLVSGQDGDTQAFDLVRNDAEDPPRFSKADMQPANSVAAETQSTTLPNQGPPKKMINGPAPEGAPRVLVEAAVSPQFTRLRLSAAEAGANLPIHGFARSGDMAIAMPGRFALDIAALRASPPERVLDAARYTNSSDSALVLDVAPDAVVRHRREGRSIIVDILPAGADPDSVDALIAQAAANLGASSPAKTPTQVPSQASRPATPVIQPTGANTPVGEPAAPDRPDPAPSGKVNVKTLSQNGNVTLEFGFEAPAPAAVFRRGDAIYVLFATRADFDVSQVKASGSLSSITPVKGEGVGGVQIITPANIVANPNALGGLWRIQLTPTKPEPARTIAIDREQVPDGTSRLKAIVPDAMASGTFVDPIVGDTLLIGLALGPTTPLIAPRAFIEANLPETYHGLVVAPKTDDFALRRSMDGFVLARPNGMALSDGDFTGGNTRMVTSAPGVVDTRSWQMGPMADFTKNLDRLRLGASREEGEGGVGVQGRLDLARFLIAWDLGAEASGVLQRLQSDVPSMNRAPEVVALDGIAKILQGRGKEGLETLSQPEVVDDPASQLWAGLGAQLSGNNEEAAVRFGRGQSALGKFGPQHRALFDLAHAKVALDMGDIEKALELASRAQSGAMVMGTKLRAGLVRAIAQGKSGAVDEALASLALLESVPDAEVASRARMEKAILSYDHGKATLPDTIRALDALRYTWRGDDLEIDVLRRLGELYIKGGDIRSGLTTMASATSLRTDLPAARLLRDELFEQFKYLFLEGGADGMPPVQALALFYDFKDLAPIGPDGDRMVRGLADRLVALDLLPQATQLLQHQVDKRLEGFAKAQVATDLAAIYLMDRRAQEALKTIWTSRVTLLPEALNAQRRLIEAAALAELGRTDHAVEIIEFDTSPDASRLRAELFLRAGDWAKAAANARATLPAVKAEFEPEEAGEVLRTAIASTLAGENQTVRDLVARYGTVMSKSAYGEAFNVVTNPAVPEPEVLTRALASVTGGSPYQALMSRLRTRLADIAAQNDAATAVTAAQTDMPTPADPYDGNPRVPTGSNAPLVPQTLPTAPATPSTPSVVATTQAPPPKATTSTPTPVTAR